MTTPKEYSRIRASLQRVSTNVVSRLAGCCAVLALLALCPSPGWAFLADYQAAVTNEPSLVSYYTFDENNANDARSTNHGTLTGTTSFATGIGSAGKALSLGGLGQVNLGRIELFAFADTTGSVEAWVQAGNFSGNPCILANRETDSRWSIHMSNGKASIGMWNGGFYATIPIPNPSTDWHHLASVFDNGTWAVYWDGALVGSTFQILGYSAVTNSTQIGSPSPAAAGSEKWIGMLDEVAFYTDALSAESVQAHYLAFFAGNPPVITKQPQSGTYLPAMPLTLSVQATGPNLSYQWYKGASALVDNTASTLSFPSLATTNAGTYTVVVTNAAGAVTSAPAVIALSSSLPAQLAAYQAAISNETGLVSYYTFDHLLPEDVIGQNEGTLAGTAGWGEGIGGGPAAGLQLDGLGHVRLGTVADLDFSSGNGTVEGWIRADWVTASGFPCMFADRDSATTWSLHMSANKSTLTFYNGADSWLYTIPGGAGTNWHHVAMVFTGGTNATYYWDGALLGVGTHNLGSPNSATLQLGSSADSTTREGWIGMLDEVAFYTNALSAASVQAHYSAYFADTRPVITSQPEGGDFLVGQQLQMTVAANGAQLTYKWYKDGIVIPNATNATLGPVTLTTDHAGEYYVTVANAAGSTNSALAFVHVGNYMANYQATVLSEPSLLSYYTFDAGDARDAKDAHPGISAGAVAFGSGPGGVTNQALTLDGSGHIDIGQVADFDFPDGSGTLEAWIRPNWANPAPNDPTIVANRNGGSDWSIHMGRWKNEIGNWNNDRFQTMSIPGAAGWHHYAIVFDASTVSMYWDGKPLGTFIQAINLFSGRTTQIGSSAPTATAAGWMGDLDEVAFYSAALSAETISRHYLSMIVSPAPKLSYSLNGTQLTLSWPTDVTGYMLEYAENLHGASWIEVGGVANNKATVDASAGQRFFRLRK